MVQRGDLVNRALWLEWLTLAWMLVEAAVAIGSGITAHSLTLIAFGADSVIELASAAVLIWRLTAEARQGAAFAETVEKQAARIGAALLFALAIYVVITALWGLWARNGQEFSLPGLIVALAAIPVMIVLARAKLRIAADLGSAALRADAAEAIACGYLSAVVIFGLVAQWLTGASWIDSVSALILVPLLLREAVEAWQNDHD